MKIDFNTLLTDLTGKPFAPEKDASGKDVPVLLKTICVRALTTPLAEDQSLTGEAAFKRLEVARKIYAGGEQDIDPADATLIRDRVAKLFSIEVSGLVYELLRG